MSFLPSQVMPQYDLRGYESLPGCQLRSVPSPSLPTQALPVKQNPGTQGNRGKTKACSEVRMTQPWVSGEARPGLFQTLLTHKGSPPSPTAKKCHKRNFPSPTQHLHANLSWLPSQKLGAQGPGQGLADAKGSPCEECCGVPSIMLPSRTFIGE